MAEILIIGSGPAGVSASLYTARAGISTTIISNGKGALERAEKIENYYGFADVISGTQLQKQALDGAKRIGVKTVDGEVYGISWDGMFTVGTSAGDFTADSVIIATGSPRKAPDISGLKNFEGKGVSYCAVCDAFFYRGKDVAVLGDSDYAVHEAMELLPVAKSVTILTNGKEFNGTLPENAVLREDKLSRLIGDERLGGAELVNGETLSFAGLFVALGTAGSTALARKIGAVTDGNKITVDTAMATNIPGLFAAGDCTGGMLQIAKAVCDGAIAGGSAVKFIRNGK